MDISALDAEIAGLENNIAALEGEIEEESISAASELEDIAPAFELQESDVGAATDLFLWGYSLDNGSNLLLMDKNKLESFLRDGSGNLREGVTQNGDSYSFNYRGMDINFNIKNGYLSYKYNGHKGNFKCELYASEDATRDTVNNTVTVLTRINKATAGQQVTNRSIFIYASDLVEQHGGAADHPYNGLAASYLASFLAGDDGSSAKPKVHNSILGYSIGAVGTGAVMSVAPPNFYKSAAIFNGSLYSVGRSDYVKKYGNYDGIANLDEMIFFESKNNNMGNTSWNPAIEDALNSTMNSGINKGNISLYTNDSRLLSYGNNNGINTTEIDSSFDGHGSAYDMMTSSGIISYLSNK